MRTEKKINLVNTSIAGNQATESILTFSVGCLNAGTYKTLEQAIIQEFMVPWLKEAGHAWTVGTTGKFVSRNTAKKSAGTGPRRTLIFQACAVIANVMNMRKSRETAKKVVAKTIPAPAPAPAPAPTPKIIEEIVKTEIGSISATAFNNILAHNDSQKLAYLGY